MENYSFFSSQHVHREIVSTRLGTVAEQGAGFLRTQQTLVSSSIVGRLRPMVLQELLNVHNTFVHMTVGQVEDVKTCGDVSLNRGGEAGNRILNRGTDIKVPRVSGANAGKFETQGDRLAPRRAAFALQRTFELPFTINVVILAVA